MMYLIHIASSAVETQSSSIEKQHVQVNVEVERAAKPLDQRHGTRLGRAARASCRAQQIARDRPIDNPKDLG